ncbi:MAG: hypothetical protein ABIQ16_18395 [Polyangiaceae bacterium]
MKLLFGVGALALGTILTVIPAPASAQTDEERAGARAAGLAGLEAYQAGKYEQAVDYFSRAESLMHAPTHLLYLARGNAKIGHLVSAREYYLKLTQDRLAPTASKPFRDAQVSGEKELNDLEPRIPYVSVVVQGAGAKDVQVTRDGERLPPALLGVPHPEDPGSHTFKAAAENMESAASTVSLKEGAHETVLLTLSQTSKPAPRAGGSTTTGTTGFGTEHPEETDSSRGGNGLRIAAFVTGGVGIVGLGVGTLFLLKSSSTRKKGDELNAACLANQTCLEPDTLQKLNGYDDDANGQRTVGAVSMAVGGAALLTGVILLVADSGGSHASTASQRVRPVFGLNYAGLAGSF